MPLRKVLSFVISFGVLAGATMFAAESAKPATTPAQQPAPAQTSTAAATSATAAASAVPEGGEPHYIKAETPQQRMERLGTQEDPGPNPDPSKIWIRFGRKFTIQKFDKEHAVYTNVPGWIRPVGYMNFTEEMYQENDKYVWAWIAEPEPKPVKTEAEQVAEEKAQMTPRVVDYYEFLRREFEPLDPPKAEIAIKFEESSNGLPTGGSYRNGMAVADINEDGHVDLITPPQRGPATFPEVYLGDGKGNWKRWPVRFPRRFTYGDVVAADFNHDKHIDLAFSVHLAGVAIFLGNGKGDFREVTTGLSSNFPTRRLVATDVDHDGWTDVVAISEGPIGRGKELKGKGFANLRGYLNRNKGESWEGINVSAPKQPMGGDWLSYGDFNGDHYPDFVGSSIYFNSIYTLYRSTGRPGEYEAIVDNSAHLVPLRSYYRANTTGHFSSSKRDDAIVSFYRAWPPSIDPKVVPRPPVMSIIGVDRISFDAKGNATRSPIIRWTNTPSIFGLDKGDFDGDGKLDIIYTRHSPREADILLGDGKGDFKLAKTIGLPISTLRNYDLTVADVNEDGRPDVIMMYETESSTQTSFKNGKVQVFLNRGPVPAPAPEAAPVK